MRPPSASALRTCAAAICVGLLSASAPAEVPDPDEYEARSRAFSERMEARGLAEPFRGITTDGEVIGGLFPIESTGVSTEPVWQAAAAFIDTLSPEQQESTLYPVDDEQWRKWANMHIYYRDGISFDDMDDDQREAAFAMLGESLSARGLELSRDIMRLNHTLAELRNNNFVEYGEGKYWVTIMGTPSSDEPWGWQLDGHHLNLNYFVLGDQVVMTPAFWGSEPTRAHSGRYAGTVVMEEEQDQGLAMIRSLSDAQRGEAVLEVRKTGNNILAQAFSDNLIVDYAGIRATELDSDQRQDLLELIGLYVGNVRDGHAQVKMDEVEAHLDDTWFAWIGGTDTDSVFYYRIQSPVILIEFDHQTPVALTHLHPEGVPNREHVHAVVRTPNGNDYGKDLLRQHHEQHDHGQGAHVHDHNSHSHSHSHSHDHDHDHDHSHGHRH